ncbi:response regulator [Aeoliella sp. SH292]|uniref:response regulator n=1 Tax=Aeoliella sp. SH292 TaxID=3454464 RepID=UPI003F9A3CE0
MKKIRIFIADDHAVLRSGLRLLMESQNDMEVVGEAGDFAEALSQLPEVRPDILTLDLSMPGGLGLKGIEKICQRVPGLRVIVLTMHDDPAYLRTALAMGVSGYVVKSAADSELLSAIRAVSQGRIFVDARSSTATIGTTSHSSTATPADSPFNKLSAREKEVLGLIAQGHTNQAVADQLDVSVKTIESYRSRLMEKLGLQNRADLTRFAVEQGLLSSGPREPLL